MAPLDDELFDAFQQSAWDNGKKFLPADCFERLFTADALAVEFADSQWARIEAGIDDLKMLAAILLYIGELDTLPEFHETGFRDSYLPMKEVKEMTEAGSEQRVLESVRTGKRFGSLGNRARAVHAFLDAQWYFRAPVLCGMDLQTFDMECCLPFIENGGCFSKGSFGEVYAIKVHHAHLLLNPRPNEGDEPLLALKQLKPTAAKEGFDREYAALKRLQEAHHHHLIQAIASFARGENCFFLFPWADGGDMLAMWKELDKRSRTPEMVFWAFEQMAGLASALFCLHHYTEAKHGGQDDLREKGHNFSEEEIQEYGRHGDLKPQNIIVFHDNPNEPLGRLCITDAGLARFHVKVTSERVADTVTTGGTVEYGPPEASEKSVRSRKYDQWSLGCIYLEFAIWLLGGYAEVERFRLARHSGSPQGQYFDPGPKDKRGQKSKKSHPKVLPAVSSWIKAVRKDGRCKGDTAFGALITIIETHLLQTDVSCRRDAEGIVKDFDTIMEKAKNKKFLFNKPDREGCLARKPLSV